MGILDTKNQAQRAAEARRLRRNAAAQEILDKLAMAHATFTIDPKHSVLTITIDWDIEDRRDWAFSLTWRGE